MPSLSRFETLLLAVYTSLYKLRNAWTKGISKAAGGLHSVFDEIVSIENLLCAWKEFRRGKRKKLDVARFEFTLEDNLFKLYDELKTDRYVPDLYEAFYVEDPKLRHIHKASVRDRVLHQAIFRVLYPIFDKYFIHDSYSSRVGKGTHAGNERVAEFLRKTTRNWTQQAWVLKCDVKKFFDSISHEILLSLIRANISDEKAIGLIETIIRSFEKSLDKGLPLGNVTSQLFANIYMNEFDQFAKHILKAKQYARYCDDFIIVNRDRNKLDQYIPVIRDFLSKKLKLDLHPKKVVIRKARQGIDFLGYVILPHRKILRTKTKKRMLKMVNKKNLSSYLGMLSHCEGKTIERNIKMICDTMDFNESL